MYMHILISTQISREAGNELSVLSAVSVPPTDVLEEGAVASPPSHLRGEPIDQHDGQEQLAQPGAGAGGGGEPSAPTPRDSPPKQTQGESKAGGRAGGREEWGRGAAASVPATMDV